MAGDERPSTAAAMGDGASGKPIGPPTAGDASDAIVNQMEGEATVDTSDIPEDPYIHKLEVVVSWVLRIGVVLSVAIVIAGLGLLFAHHPGYTTLSHGVRYQTLTRPRNSHGVIPFPHTFGELVHSLSLGQGRGVIVLGLVVLLATPVLRVAVGVVGFGLERDLKMTLATSFVLLVLLFSIFFVGR